MNTIINIEITTNELHKSFKKYNKHHPELDDQEKVINATIKNRWPDISVDQVLHAATINQLNKDRIEQVRKESADLSTWVPTGVQVDLFDDRPVSVPKNFNINGVVTPYYEVSLSESLPYFMSRKSALSAEADAFQQASSEKQQMSDKFSMQITITRELISTAKENGLDPSEIKYAKAN